MTTIVTRIQMMSKMVIAFTISRKNYPNIFVGSSKYQLSYLSMIGISVEISFEEIIWLIVCTFENINL
jgi:hypothetical protein